MKLIRDLIISLKIYFHTRRTQKWVIKTISKICELQLEDFSLFKTFSLKAYGTYLEYRDDKLHFAINLVDDVKCHYYANNIWNCIYKQKAFIFDYQWIREIEKVDLYMTKENLYYLRMKQLQEETQWA